MHVEATIEYENNVNVSFDFASSSRIPDSSLSWLGHTICVRGGERIKNMTMYHHVFYSLFKVMLDAANDIESSSVESGVVLPGESLFFLCHLSVNCSIVALVRTGQKRGADDQA